MTDIENENYNTKTDINITENRVEKLFLELIPNKASGQINSPQE